MARNKKKTLRDRFDEWLSSHPKAACAIIGSSVALTLVGICLFVRPHDSYPLTRLDLQIHVVERMQIAVDFAHMLQF
ncbi:MAG: hypothetical protein IJI12_00470, partial [Atopobiaceae bacterium]|nr:hypothetical protein [Atopobiaceae bacterium]